MTTHGLRLSDYVLDPDSGVRLPPSMGAAAGYLDGGEQRLAQIFAAAKDLGSDSAELARQITDWVTRYHLSPYRSTLFDAIGLTAHNARVLELGAGCGAITRWLGEHCAAVHAIEGDPRRARVTRLRCGDLPNVEVYAGNYSELDEHDAFDLVTLIGVLEYGHHYLPAAGGDPRRAAEMNLAVARRALVDDGLLVLAIENRIGLKYLGGAREDHSGRPYDSVMGYPAGGPAQTFNVRELQELLGGAGFAEQVLLAPFPDYKLASTIVNLGAVRADDRIHNWVDTPAPDRGFERGQLPFNETLATREIARAGLLGELSNSVLVLGFAGDPEATAARLGIDLDWVARHWSLDRRQGLGKRATLRRRDDGAVVAHEPAAGSLGAAAQEQRRRVAVAQGVCHNLVTEPFRRGDLLAYRAHEAMAAEGIGRRFADLIGAHAAWLSEHFGTATYDDAGIELVSGAAFDATWWNLVVDPDDGAWQLIDPEWEIAGLLPLDGVLRRTVEHFALRNRTQLPAQWINVAAADLAAHALALAGFAVSEERRGYLEALDRDIALAIGPGSPESCTVDRVSVLAHADEVIASPHLLSAYAERFGAGDPVTLVLYAPRASEEELAPRLEAAMRAAGLDPDGGADLLLHAPPHADAATEHTLATAMAAQLTRSPPASGPFADLPCFDAAELHELQALVARWTLVPAGHPG